MGSLDWACRIMPKARRVLGVFISEAEIFLVEMDRRETDGRLYLRQARAEKAAGKAGAPWDSPELLAGTLFRLCMTYGLPCDKISLCLPRELFFVYEREFPPMDREELTAATHWDIETNVPFAEGAYWSGFGAHGERMELAALPREYGRDLTEAMTAAGLSVEALSMEPLRFTHSRAEGRILWRGMEVELSAAAAREPWTHGLSMALYAAFRVFCPSVGVEFLPPEERGSAIRLWRAGGNLIAASVLAASVFFLVWNLLRISAADARIDELRQEYALESRERDDMAALEGERRQLLGTEGLLQSLSGERRSWYAVFSALGATTVDGVSLTEFDVQENGAVLCGGSAPSHGRLVAYLDRLAREETAFREKPILQESTVNERGEIRFKIKLQFSY